VGRDRARLRAPVRDLKAGWSCAAGARVQRRELSRSALCAVHYADVANVGSIRSASRSMAHGREIGVDRLTFEGTDLTS